MLVAILESQAKSAAKHLNFEICGVKQQHHELVNYTN